MVRTRFAPSPTGYLHIGGVRTALYNWLFARKHGGQFILRIDDTDAERNVAGALEPILHGFHWLGIDWDEGPEVGGDHGPYYQSERRSLHQAAVAKLVEQGLAYYDYATPEELASERDAAREDGRAFVYSRHRAAETMSDRQAFERQGRRGVVRLKMPREGICRFTDIVRGEMEFEWAREQDHVVQRPDGSCLYHLTSAVDDHALAISHVIRAEEHLSNTPRQIFIMQGLGYELPRYAHLPYVAEPGSKTKLSKRKLEKYLKNPDFAERHRHGLAIAEAISLETAAETFNPVIVDFYEQVGYLPEALLNYLLLLGWSLDDKTEFFSREEMIESFSLERVQKSPASFDPKKLWAFQEHHMNQLPLDDKVERLLPFLLAGGQISDSGEETRSYVTRIAAAAGDRIKAAGDVLDYVEFFTSDSDLAYDQSVFNKRLLKPHEACGLVTKLRAALEQAAAFDAQSLEALVRGFVETEGIKMGEVVHALRVALTGKAVGFGLFEILEILGRERALARIDRALQLAAEAKNGQEVQA